MKKRYIHLLFIVEVVCIVVLGLFTFHKNIYRSSPKSTTHISKSATLGESTYRLSDKVPSTNINLIAPDTTERTTTSGKGILGFILQLVTNGVTYVQDSFQGEK